MKNYSKQTWLSRLVLGAAIMPALYACGPEEKAAKPVSDNWHKTSDGVVVTLADSTAKKVRLQVVNDHIVRVTATPQQDFNNLPNTLMIVAQPEPTQFDVSQKDSLVVLKTGELSAEVSLVTGVVSFKDEHGRVLTTEVNRGNFSAVTRDPGHVDADSFAVRQQFTSDENEGYYGLGQQQDGEVNYAGDNVELTTYNLEITIPYVVSSKDYALLWNNTSISRLGDPSPSQPLKDGFKLYDAKGNPGGLTARYFDGDKLLLERVEADLDYQFLSQGSNRANPMPEVTADAENLRVEWEGTIESDTNGVHELKMYSSGYAKLYLNGELVLDRWRMNWNPWYHNTKLDMQAGKKVALKLDWQVDGGYMRIKQHKPLPVAEQGRLSIASDTAKAIDYYFVVGDNKDELVSGYRTLTGDAVMLPKWVFGFWQSRERYTTQDQIIDALQEYRDRKIPIDSIVLDWSYWPQDAWGSHDFDEQFFPDPSGLVDKVHALDGNIMISVWPKFYPTTDNYKALNAKGCMFNKNIEQKNLDWIGEGYLNGFYDAYNPECREMFWAQIRDKINVHGFDAWWLDAVEPDIHSNLSFEHRKDLMSPNALGTGAEVFNAYALPHAETVYQGERRDDGDKRAFILTRSGFAGIQRTGSAIWSGDVVSRWSDLKEQIAAGVGVGISGMPYWTFDIGGFTPEDRYRYSAKGSVGHVSMMNESEVPEWQEINLRWFQFGTFVPLFRSHGQNPYREIFNIADKGSEVYDSMVWYTKTRYRLMPYIYSLVGDAHHKDGTFMRALVMDFPNDLNVRDINDQYMFGPALLINPVSEFQARKREVYLPAGTDWYNFYTGAKQAGGKTITADAPLAQMPIFVKAGAIIPTGVEIQHVYDQPDAPYTLNVYTGADGSFEIYEDDGKTYGYEQGAWARIPVTYNDKTGELTIGDRVGSFEGMTREREFRVRWISGTRADAADFDAGVAKAVTYTGKAVTIKR